METTMTRTLVTAVASLGFLTALISAQAPQRAPDPRSMGGGDCRDNAYNCADAPNPLPAPNTVWLEEMTWMDVRDSLKAGNRSEEHTSELQSRLHLVCRLLLEKKKKKNMK